MNLIDTSAWVEFLRKTGSRANIEVRELMLNSPHEVAITEPVVMELLAGTSDERAFAQVDTLTAGLRLLTVEAALDYRAASVAYRAVRARGGTVRKVIDCLIAVVAIRTGATLLHRDRDFDVLAATLPDLKVRSLI